MNLRDGFGVVRVLGQPDWGGGSGYGEREILGVIEIREKMVK
jgi:hypothetical protein